MGGAVLISLQCQLYNSFPSVLYLHCDVGSFCVYVTYAYVFVCVAARMRVQVRFVSLNCLLYST